MKTIGIYTKKGGVGKTLTAVTLSAALVKKGFKTLLIDLDKQRNSNTLLGINDGQFKYTIYNAMQRVIDEDDQIEKELLIHTVQGIDLIAGSIKLKMTNQLMQSVENSERILNQILCKYDNEYDYCLIDCNPSDVYLADNVLMAADSVIVPIEMDFLSVQALNEVNMEIKRMKEYNTKLKIEGILYNKVQSHTKICQDYMKEIKEGFPEIRIFNQFIPLSIDCKNACDSGVNLIQYKPSSKVSIAYLNLVDELEAGGVINV